MRDLESLDNPRPLLSIVTVVRNSLPLLKSTVASLNAQTESGFEYVILDGDSTDGTKAFVLGAPSPASKVISKADGGIYDAMNKSVDLCAGLYIQFLNAGDCLLAPDTVHNILPFLDGEADVIIFNYVMGSTRYAPRVGLRDLLGGMPCHQAIFYRRDSLGERRFDTRFRYCADYAHLLEAIHSSRVVLSTLPVVKYDLSGLSSDIRVRRRIRMERVKSAMVARIPWSWKLSIVVFNLIRLIF